MKNTKKLILSIIAIIVALSSAFSVYAYPSVEGFGTYEDGIIPPIKSYVGYHNPIPEDTHPNLDFSMGLMYWTNGNAKKPSEAVKLVTEGDNTFIQIIPTNDENQVYEGIESPKFCDERIQAGDLLVTVYDWRGSEKHNIQVYINQRDVPQKSRLTAHFKTVKVAENEGDWNTSVCLNQYPVNQTLNNAEIFISVGAQAFQDSNCSTQIDNIRIGKWDKKTNDIHDLDGNFLCNLGPVKSEGKEEEKDTSKDADVSESDKNSKQDNPSDENSNNSSSNTIIIIAVSATAVIILAIVIAIIFVLKKKPNK